MESRNAQQTLFKDQPDMEHQATSWKVAHLRSFLPRLRVTPASHTAQAERAAMQPDRHDLEWRYFRNRWLG
jgi:hypothetical protein